MMTPTPVTYIIKRMTELAQNPDSFRIKIAGTGEVLEVPPHKSILFVLIENGYKVRSSCSDGRCGTCKTRFVGGEPDHRDSVLSADEHDEFLTVCVSRAQSEELILDVPAPGATYVDPSRPIAIVTQDICVACLTCVRACAFGAARINPELVGVGGIMGAATIDADECTGCGLCAAACPTGAIGMNLFADHEVFSEVESLLSAKTSASDQRHSATASIVTFCCPNSRPSVAAFPERADAANVDLDIVEMPCTGRVDNLYLMRAFENGADGVIVSGCEPGHCMFSRGNTNAAKRVQWISDWLDKVGLESSRVRMVHLPDEGAEQFADSVRELAGDIETLGPSPIGRPVQI